MSHKIDRTGEIRTMQNGLVGEIICYRNNKDIDIKFSDGRIAQHMNYHHFVKGDLSGTNLHREKARKERIGLVKTMNSGKTVKITDYNNTDDITFKFDDGITVKGRWNSFINGEILYPGKTGQDTLRNKNKEEWIGKTAIASNGQKITCIDYKSARNLTVEFEDGYIAYNIYSGNFVKGRVLNPNYTVYDSNRSVHIGETNTNTQGCIGKIIKYKSWSDITVEFDDGTIIQSTYGQFKIGKFQNPNKPRIRKNIRTGETAMSMCGLEMKIVEYIKTSNITVEFEDGVRVKTSYTSFKDGHVKHPKLKINAKSCDYAGFIAKYACMNENNAYYTCECKICKMKGIFTPKQMIEHNNTEHSKENKNGEKS